MILGSRARAAGRDKPCPYSFPPPASYYVVEALTTPAVGKRAGYFFAEVGKMRLTEMVNCAG